MVVSVYVASKYQIDVVKQVLLFYLPKIKPEFSANSLWKNKNRYKAFHVISKVHGWHCMWEVRGLLWTPWYYDHNF